MFAAHSWPRFGNARVQEVMRTQRDAYANLNNDVLHLANRGVTINEIHNVYRQPASLERQWAAHSYRGSDEHNSRAVINRYLGYWDANPATLIPLSPRDSAPLYVEMMGGAARITAKGRERYDAGKYRKAMEIVNKQQAKSANLTVTLNRSDLESVMGGKATFDTPDFELMPGTKPGKVPPPEPRPKDPFEVIQSDTKGVP